MHRRSFLTSLGALLVTSALVKPAISAWTNTSMQGPFFIPPLGGSYICIVSPWQMRLYDQPMAIEDELEDLSWPQPRILSGYIGEYQGIRFVEKV